MAVPMANGPPFATLNHVAADLGIPNESEPLRVGISHQLICCRPRGSGTRGVAVLRVSATPSSVRRGGQSIHGLGELDVAIGHAAGIVSRKRHFDLVVDVEPFWMMVEFLRDQRRARHEAEGLVEVAEREFPADGVAALHLAPAVELGERALAGGAGQFLCHGPHLTVAAIVPRIAVRWPLATAP